MNDRIVEINNIDMSKQAYQLIHMQKCIDIFK